MSRLVSAALVVSGQGRAPIGRQREGFQRDRDKGDDDQKPRLVAHDYDIRPPLKRRGSTSLHTAWNARLDSDLYYQRNMNGSANAATNRRFGAVVRSRRWEAVP